MEWVVLWIQIWVVSQESVLNKLRSHYSPYAPLDYERDEIPQRKRAVNYLNQRAVKHCHVSPHKASDCLQNLYNSKRECGRIFGLTVTPGRKATQGTWGLVNVHVSTHQLPWTVDWATQTPVRAKSKARSPTDWHFGCTRLESWRGSGFLLFQFNHETLLQSEPHQLPSEIFFHTHPTLLRTTLYS